MLYVIERAFNVHGNNGNPFVPTVVERLAILQYAVNGLRGRLARLIGKGSCIQGTNVHEPLRDDRVCNFTQVGHQRNRSESFNRGRLARFRNEDGIGMLPQTWVLAIFRERFMSIAMVLQASCKFCPKSCL